MKSQDLSSNTYFSVDFRTFNRDTSRKEGLKKIPAPKSNIYNGWWDKWLENFRFKLKKYLMCPFKFLKSLGVLIIVTFIRLFDYLFNFWIKKPLIFNKSGGSLKWSPKIKDNHSSVKVVFDDLQRFLSGWIDTINSEVKDDSQKLTLTSMTDKEFTISGARGSVRAYITGSDTIYIIDSNFREKKLNFRLSRSKLFRRGYYYTLNDRPIFIKTAAFLIYDAISMHLK